MGADHCHRNNMQRITFNVLLAAVMLDTEPYYRAFILSSSELRATAHVIYRTDH